MDYQETVNKFITFVSMVLIVVAVAGLYFNINSIIGWFFDYKKATMLRIVFDVALLINAIFLIEKVKGSR